MPSKSWSQLHEEGVKENASNTIKKFMKKSMKESKKTAEKNLKKKNNATKTITKAFRKTAEKKLKKKNNASKTITKAVRKTAEKSKETKAKAEKLKKTEKKNEEKALKLINKVKIYLRELKAQITNSYKKKLLPQFVFLNLDKTKNNSLSRKELTQLLKSGTIIKYLKLVFEKSFITLNDDKWFLCLTGYVEKESNEISHQLGLVAYKKDTVKNFSGFKNKTNKFKFKTKIFLDLGKNNKLTNTSVLTAKIKGYLSSKVKNKNNYIKNYNYGLNNK